MNSQQVIDRISNSKKKTFVKLFLKGELSKIDFSNVRFFGNKYFGTIFGEWNKLEPLLLKNKKYINDYEIENQSRNSAIPLLDLKNINARIEPGAFIREMVSIGDNCVIMMGAVINIGAEIGKKTMIDMNAVIGGNAKIGENCHIGAGAVIAGVIEPPNANPVVIENNVVVGANAVILEGVRIGMNSVVAAGTIVLDDVKSNSVVAGIPARVIKNVDDKTKAKTKIIESLRNLRN